MTKITFVLGGAKCGKTKFALKEANKWPSPRIYLATAENLDEEMGRRIKNHKLERGKDWQTLEVSVQIAEALNNLKDNNVVLLDCITLWLNNLLGEYKNEKQKILEKLEDLLKAIKNYSGPIIIVSNDVSGGIVPLNKLAREFRDLAGTFNQNLASLADEVFIVTAGISQKIK